MWPRVERKDEGKEREKEERNGSTIQSCTRPFVSFFISLTEKAVVSEEFVAHGALVNVNCLRIGKKTSRIIATGGEDHRVNVWALGRPDAIMVCSFLSPLF